MTDHLSEDRCPQCAKKLTDHAHVWAECAECGYVLVNEERRTPLEPDDRIDWMEGYDDD